jgi:hypothetical protein
MHLTVIKNSSLMMAKCVSAPAKTNTSKVATNPNKKFQPTKPKVTSVNKQTNKFIGL